MKEKIPLGLAAVLAAICWLAACLDLDTLMYLSGILAVSILWCLDSSSKFFSKHSKI